MQIFAYCHICSICNCMHSFCSICSHLMISDMSCVCLHACLRCFKSGLCRVASVFKISRHCCIYSFIQPSQEWQTVLFQGSQKCGYLKLSSALFSRGPITRWYMSQFACFSYLRLVYFFCGFFLFFGVFFLLFVLSRIAGTSATDSGCLQVWKTCKSQGIL